MANDDELRDLLSSASLVFVGGLLAAVSTLVEQIVIARVLTPDAYGEVSISIAVMTLGITMALVGFNQGIPRFISRFESPVDRRGAWATGLLIPGSISLGLAVVLILSIESVTGLLFERFNSELLLLLFVVSIPFEVGQRVGVGAIRGHENTIYKTYTADLLYPGLRIGLLAVLLAAGYGVVAAGIAYLGASIVTFVAAHVLLNRLLPLVGRVEFHTREMLVFSAPLVISTVLGLLLTKTDTLMLGYFRPSAEVGIYTAAYTVANGMNFVLIAFGFLYLPVISRLDAGDRRDEVDEIYTTLTKWGFIVTFPAFLVFAFFPEDVLSLFFGQGYAAGGLALTILAFGFLTNSLAGRNKETLSAFGSTKSVLAGNAVAFGLNIVLNLALIPPYGQLGAAVASAASIIALNATVLAILHVGFGISPFSISVVRTCVVLPVTLVPVMVAATGWFSLGLVTFPLLLVVLGVLVVAISGAAGGFQPEDEVLIEFVEERFGITVPFVRRFIPPEGSQSAS
jgi:O-antigen/teichoic acid export membrane protein